MIHHRLLTGSKYMGIYWLVKPICSQLILSLPPGNIKKPYSFLIFPASRERVHWKQMRVKSCLLDYFLHTLPKIPQFRLLSWCKNVLEMCSFCKALGDCETLWKPGNSTNCFMTDGLINNQGLVFNLQLFGIEKQGENI